MSVDAPPDEVDFVFFAEDLPDEDGVHRIAIAVEGMSASIPTAMITLGIDDALRMCDVLNRRLGHDRYSWTAFAARCLRSPATGPGTGP